MKKNLGNFGRVLSQLRARLVTRLITGRKIREPTFISNRRTQKKKTQPCGGLHVTEAPARGILGTPLARASHSLSVIIHPFIARTTQVQIAFSDNSGMMTLQDFLYSLNPSDSLQKQDIFLIPTGSRL
jgi:hypothetical protein